LTCPQLKKTPLGAAPDLGADEYVFYTTATRVITYVYDALNRLTGAEYSTGEFYAYAYDAVGNANTVVECITLTITITYSYNAADRLVTATGSSDSTVWWYTCDDRGNLIRQRHSGMTVQAQSQTSTEPSGQDLAQRGRQKGRRQAHSFF
jgi:YD repeat-containing protein